ncbi:MAG: M28 family peptidase [Planctomycetota bacterium]
MQIPITRPRLLLLAIPCIALYALVQDPAPAPAPAEIPKGAVTPEELRDLVEKLASDEFEGRGSGASGGRKAGDFIAEQLKARGVEPFGIGGGYFQSFDAPPADGGRGAAGGEGSGGSYRNIIGIVRGADPKLKEEFVIIGAHYDHCGLGDQGAGAGGNRGEIHHGADDNASGTSTVLTVARLVAAKPLPRSVIFILFDAEERGLWGSAHYADKPLAPHDKTQIMINIDMVGRSYDRYLFVAGLGTAAQLDDIVTRSLKAESKYLNKIERSNDNENRSDQHNFYLKNIPVMFLFTGIHRDYHQPRDTADKIQYKPLAAVTRAVYESVKITASMKEKLVFQKTGMNGMPKGSDAVQALNFKRAVALNRRLGGQIAPSADLRPMFLDTEAAGSRAGIEKNDVILGIAKGNVKKVSDFKEVKTVEELRVETEKYKSGDPVTLRVRRDGKEKLIPTKIGDVPEWKYGPANDAGDLPRPKAKT